MTVRKVRTCAVADLPSPWSDDPYLLGEHADATVVAARATPDALVAVLAHPGRDTGLFGLGDPRVVSALITGTDDAAARCEPCAPFDLEEPDVWAAARYATLVRGTLEHLGPQARERLGLTEEGSAWDWMWTVRAAPDDDPRRAVRLPLGPATAFEVREFLSRGHPTASTAPDDERLIGWWGVREGGRLVAAIGAITLGDGMAPHLVSLGVDPEARGQGLAGVVMAAAVRDCLEIVPSVGPRMVSLGLYASNDVARRVYERLGFTLLYEFASQPLLRVSDRGDVPSERARASDPVEELGEGRSLGEEVARA